MTIIAEGIDTGEDDEVFFNGVSVGFLTQQGFSVPNFNLNPGAGALPGITALTEFVFNVMALPGINMVAVNLDPSSYVNEIETSTLNGIPEPGTFAMLGGGGILIGLGALRRRLAAKK
ncbi:MAG: PEP-CTERM sorting domain-containing protein [Bryobacteraceae bacterium]|nr:PEP-CTERM sorting domain-containing protein [Bryobacteraceae bacterium]